MIIHFSASGAIDAIRTFDCGESNKPQGALWVSDESAKMSWSRFCFRKDYEPKRLLYKSVIVLKDTPRNLHIACPDQFDRFEATFGIPAYPDGIRVIQAIDWCAVAKHYDLVLISPYQPDKACDRLDDLTDRRNWYAYWDAASGAILSPRAVERIYPAIPTHWVFTCEECDRETCMLTEEGRYVCSRCEPMTRAAIKRNFANVLQPRSSQPLV